MAASWIEGKHEEGRRQTKIINRALTCFIVWVHEILGEDFFCLSRRPNQQDPNPRIGGAASPLDNQPRSKLGALDPGGVGGLRLAEPVRPSPNRADQGSQAAPLA